MELPNRIIGSLEGSEEGPTLVVSGAVHGNEGAGVDAIDRALSSIRELDLRLRGRVLGLVGNRRALARGRRFVDWDLNRRWESNHLRDVVRGEHVNSEDDEQRELLEVLGPYLRHAQEPVTFLDLHSTSGHGVPFALAGDVLRNRQLAFSLGIPVVLGLDEVVDGAMLSYICDLGHIGVAIEGGRQGDPRTVDHLEAAIWVALVNLGILDRRDAPGLTAHRRRLRNTAGGVPHVLEVVYRHVVTPEDEFEMKPGYRSFQAIARHDIVARNRNGPVRAPEDGLMLLPRYQGVGEDGFFIARPVRRAWLRASALVRRLGLERTLAFLPGVEPDPANNDALVARGRAAGLLSKDIFYLFGYRRSRSGSGGQVFMRRQPDHVALRAPPAKDD